MPEEQSTPAESGANVEATKADLDPTSDSGQSPTMDQPAKAESTATDSPKSSPLSSKSEEKKLPQPSTPKPDQARASKTTPKPEELSATHPSKEEKSTQTSAEEPTEKPTVGTAQGTIGAAFRESSPSAPPGSKGTQTGAKAKSPSKATKPTSKKTSPTAKSTQETTVGDSKIEAVLTQIVGAVGKILGSILSTLGNQIQKLSFYSKIEPVVKGISLLWSKVIVPFGNVVIKPIWGLGLKVLRGRFSDGLKPFSDRFLTIVILSFATLIYWGFSSLIPPSQPTVQQQPAPAPVAKAPALAPVSQPNPISPPSTPVAEVPVEEPPPPPEPEPKPIIEVQSQVAQVFDQYSQDLIEAVQANFEDEQLVVKVSDRWFELSEAEQNQLGTDALERSRKLDFAKLEIRDQTDQLLAREPVVGSNIIVLQRRTPPPELAPDSPA